MPSRLDPRTWLLAVIALWAVLCAVIAISGFGDQYSLLPDDPTLAPHLPAVRSTQARSTMGALEVYSEAYNHPLFYPDRKPIAVHVAGQDSAPAQPLDVALTSVIMTPKLQMAIVEDPKTKESYRVHEGQPIGGSYNGWKLSGLSPRSATFDGGSQGQTVLDLRIYDGRGGEEPTRMGLTPQAIASGVLGPARGAVNTVDPNAPPSPDSTDAPPADATADANRAATEAAQQAEEIRKRIELRRQQAQAQHAASLKEER